MEQQLNNPAQPPPVEPPAPPLLPPEAKPAVSHPFVFHGEAREYFRIWIVNTLLTLLTLGLYAAWAKVRKRRYLRGNTELMGHRFDYRADPRRILAGNILVALMFLAYMVVGEVYPAIRLGALVGGLILLPWVIIRSFSFNAHNTVYRGMRFYFRQTYGWTAMVYIGQWFFIILSLGFYYPAWVRNRKQMVISSHRLGDAFFRFESKAGPFFSAYIVGAGMVMAAGMVGGVLTFLTTLTNHGKLPTTTQLLPFFAVYGFALYCSKHYIYASLFNHIWNHTRLDDHRFVAALRVGDWLKLQLVNLAAIIVSCGLLYPWATIRSARAALSSLRFEPQGPIEKISRLGRNDGSAMGESAAEFVGLDIGL
jgi:uncharacterized membrane protein YjgN (DUF898 family)